jgi:hypothetical protein
MRWNDPQVKGSVDNSSLNCIDGCDVNAQPDVGCRLRKLLDGLINLRLGIGYGLVENCNLDLAAQAPMDVIDTSSKRLY